MINTILFFAIRAEIAALEDNAKIAENEWLMLRMEFDAYKVGQGISC